MHTSLHIVHSVSAAVANSMALHVCADSCNPKTRALVLVTLQILSILNGHKLKGEGNLQGRQTWAFRTYKWCTLQNMTPPLPSQV